MAEAFTPVDPKYTLITPDHKGRGSQEFKQQFRYTANNFYEPGFKVYYRRGIPRVRTPKEIETETVTSDDGAGTKPEGCEMYFEDYKNPEVFESLGFDLAAMIQGDFDRNGFFLLAMDNVLDVNSIQDAEIIRSLARGLRNAANEGRFALMQGETAELGYRVNGYGDFNMNWNAFGIGINVKGKEITGQRIMPGQPIVAFREDSPRSNGITPIREFMQQYYMYFGGPAEVGTGMFNLMLEMGHNYVTRNRQYGINNGTDDNNNKARHLTQEWVGKEFREKLEHPEKFPWHQEYPEIAKQLRMPSTLYGPVIYDAQGGVYGKKRVDITGAAHITGGGIPLKVTRMLHAKGLGADISAVFPDPAVIKSVLDLSSGIDDRHFRSSIKISEEKATRTWHRGIGFLVVTKDAEEARKLIDIAGAHGKEAMLAGEITGAPEINFRGRTYGYDPNEKCP